MRPNIVVFLTDDHGPWAANCFGTPELKTPALDSLVQNGVYFQNAYTPSPVCSPARASFWTGVYPSQHGIHDWIDEKAYPRKWLPEKIPTLASLLQNAGYRTGFVGKWHCGQSWVHQPGFDFYVGENKDQYPHRGQCKFTDNGRDVTYVGQRSDFLTSRAIDFLSDTSDKRPLFLFVGLTDTHSPFTDHPQHLVDYYTKNPITSVKVERYSGTAMKLPGKVPPPAEHSRRMAQYAAAVETIDQCLGRVLDHLTALGLSSQTALLYTGDHGHMNGHHGLYFKGNGTVPQNFYDESIRVPCIWRLPDSMGAGRTSQAWVSHCDQFETILDLAGASPRTSSIPHPGVSLLPYLKGNPDTTRGTAICEYGNARMIRTADLKLIVRMGEGLSDEAYDILHDPRETTNIIQQAKTTDAYKLAKSALDAHFGTYRADGQDAFSGILPKHNASEPWSGIKLK
ncbi:MAG: sulfatase [Armatimonadota bacterium]